VLEKLITYIFGALLAVAAMSLFGLSVFFFIATASMVGYMAVLTFGLGIASGYFGILMTYVYVICYLWKEEE
jgi:hypothetical protein